MVCNEENYQMTRADMRLDAGLVRNSLLIEDAHKNDTRRQQHEGLQNRRD